MDKQLISSKQWNLEDVKITCSKCLKGKVTDITLVILQVLFENKTIEYITQ